MTKIECTCLTCGSTFKRSPSAVSEKGNYCSRACHYKSGYHLPVRSPKVSINCETCGKSFDVYPYEIEEGKRYCSNPCRFEARKGSRGGTLKKICPSCKQEFIARRCDLEIGGGIYCSRKCMGVGFTTLVDCKCLQCGTIFKRPPNHIPLGYGKYCSRACKHIGNSGENNPAWKGGGSSYRGKNWKVQRKLAYDRDGGICQRCGRKPRKGETAFPVHHIKPYRQFKGDYLAANELPNLVTLCHPCHAKADLGRVYVPKHLF